MAPGAEFYQRCKVRAPDGRLHRWLQGDSAHAVEYNAHESSTKVWEEYSDAVVGHLHTAKADPVNRYWRDGKAYLFTFVHYCAHAAAPADDDYGGDDDDDDGGGGGGGGGGGARGSGDSESDDGDSDTSGGGGKGGGKGRGKGKGKGRGPRLHPDLAFLDG